MDFINETPFPSLIHRTTLGGEKIAMSVMIRITYDVHDGIAKISNHKQWEVHNDYWTSEEYGPMDKDEVYARGGVDIMAFGSAKATNGMVTKKSEVSIVLNDKTLHRIKIYGDRYWKNSLGFLTPTNPEPFTEIPLTLYNCYGGEANWDGIKIPYHSNPYGKGYYIEKKDAIGKPLPNIESYEKSINSWKDNSAPVGVSSFPILQMKALNNIVLNKKGKNIERLKDTFFNSAYPELIVEDVVPGDVLTINGMTKSIPFVVTIPKTILQIDVKLGSNNHTEQLGIDQVGMVPDKNQIFISYRFPFKYTFQPLEKRESKISFKN